MDIISSQNEYREKLIMDAINIYYYGSCVYGTFCYNSDYDFVVVLPDNLKEEYRSYYPMDQVTFMVDGEKFDYNIYFESDWIKELNNNTVTAMEIWSYGIDSEYIVKQQKWYDANIDPKKIRHSFSLVASNSWVKAKKKLTVEKDYNPHIAKKSLWHSLRIYMFGIQMMRYGRIVDFTVANKYYNEIINSPNDWEYLKNKYQPLRNELHSQFKTEEYLSKLRGD